MDGAGNADRDGASTWRCTRFVWRYLVPATGQAGRTAGRLRGIENRRGNATLAARHCDEMRREEQVSCRTLREFVPGWM